jgi:hypothetical protein
MLTEQDASLSLFFHSVKSSTTSHTTITRSSAVNRRKTCKHYSDPSELIGEDGKHYYTGTCISCNKQIVGCLSCEYSFAESTRRRYSRDAYFNLHMGKKYKEMLHRSKIQKTSNVSLPA